MSDLKEFVDCPLSKIPENDVIELAEIDLSLFREGDEYAEQRQQLAARLKQSITTHGFFNLVNWGASEEQMKRIKDIAYSVTSLSEVEQEKYLASAPVKEKEIPGKIGGERGQGFKPKGYWALKEGMRDSITHYNLKYMYRDDFVQNKEVHPEIVREYIHDISNYFNQLHREVLPKLLSLCDIILEVPEGTLLKHYFQNSGTNNDTSESRGRFMLYTPYENEELNHKSKEWLFGHSDISAFAFVTSQPMLSLQIKDYFDGKWKYVKHRHHSLIVNIGDSLEFISGGLFKADIHRVVGPPKDQQGYERLVLIYFCNPNSLADLDPEKLNSPYLKQLGLNRDDKLKNWEKIQFHHWNYAKGYIVGRDYGGEKSTLKYFGRNVERWHHFAK